MLSAVLALLASFSWGTSDFLAGLESRRSSAWTAALAGQVVASLSLICLLAATAPARPALSALTAPGLGGAIGAAGVVLGYKALALADMSVVSPIIAGAALVPVTWGIVTGERPDVAQVLGIALALLGMVLISRGGPAGADLKRNRARAGVVAAVGCAVALGLFLVALDYGGRVGPLYAVTTARTTAALVLLAAAAVTRPAVRLRRRALPALLVVGLLIAAANILFTTATTHGYLSIVGVLGWLNPAVTMAWAAAVLHERLRPQQLLAAALVFAGIVCITLG
ncbi:MAG TPA: DMT family transporter [Thermoleophilia bacterium]|nr:DMT family transporter [Thermoleophilia bacterium]